MPHLCLEQSPKITGIERRCKEHFWEGGAATARVNLPSALRYKPVPHKLTHHLKTDVIETGFPGSPGLGIPLRDACGWRGNLANPF